jgi:hypothetical protein
MHGQHTPKMFAASAARGQLLNVLSIVRNDCELCLERRSVPQPLPRPNPESAKLLCQPAIFPLTFVQLSQALHNFSFRLAFLGDWRETLTRRPASAGRQTGISGAW